MGANLLSKIGKYDVIDVLGKGGMGVVYKAQDPRIGRTVAIKMMTGAFAENPDLLQRFYREAQSTGILQHPNIVIVHRDIKPANIMVLKEGGIKIVDFGIARLGDNTLTRTGQVVGTISYMSPEQISAKLVDRRTDIFSAGVMLYELLTYTLPFDAPDTASTLLKIVN